MDSSDDPDDPEYAELLKDLSRKWLDLEVHHCTSKSASEDFWELAKKAFPKLHKAKIDAMIFQDIPKFNNQRLKLYKNNVPPINLKNAYLNKATKEIVVVEGKKNPVSQFDPRQFEKIYEVATVEVN